MSVSWPPPANFRDLGGIPVAGGTVRPRQVFRSDDVTHAPDGFLDELVHTHGVTHVIDLRSTEESRSVDRGRLESRGIHYRNIALGAQLFVGHALPRTVRDMGEFYCRLVDQHAADLVAALGLIAASPRGVVFHCAVGKDRTGMLAAFLLAALGADDDAIVADYGVTQSNLPLLVQRWRAMAQLADDLPGLPPLSVIAALDPDDMPVLMTAPVEGLRIAMARLRERDGDLLSPLRAAGFDQALHDALRARLVEASP
ncbi:MAG: tyrosine-protein phosphatase [Microbacterium sp.]|uniref:tyrosine-protein phosphatase n=1 Tax=Microbacterium sp. TaxID=51671 RepID=UPI0039E21943